MAPPSKAASSAVEKKKRKKNVYAMADVVAEGTTLNDCRKNVFKLGKPFAQGGFGRIYDAKQITTDGKQISVVVKMEPMENGPLYQETHMYQRVAKHEYIDEWTKQNKVAFLGIPPYISSGYADVNGSRQRFLVIPKYGATLESIVNRDGRLSTIAALNAARSCCDSLHYLHDRGTVHADLKADNLLFADVKTIDYRRVVLVDFGLAKYVKDPVHKEDKKKAHDGTLQFTSIDAHRGSAPSFRGDFEILGYNLLYWLTGSLPWDKLDNPEKVFEMKVQFSKSIAVSIRKSIGDDVDISKCLIDYFNYIYSIDYLHKPDYDRLKKIIDSALKSASLSSTKTKKSTRAVAPKSDIAISSNDADDSQQPLISNGKSKKIVKKRKSSSSDDTSTPIRRRIIPGASNITKPIDSPSIVRPSSSSVVSPRTDDIRNAIPGAANMRNIRRSLGAAIVKKYVTRVATHDTKSK